MSEIIQFGGIDRIFEFLPPEYVAYIRNWCHLDLVVFKTGDILPNVLGYTYLSDTLSVMRVCKRWYAATQSRIFWKRRIQEKIRKDYCGIKHIELFNTFALSSETLRQQVEWLFRKLWISVSTEKEEDGNGLFITRKCQSNDGMMQVYIKHLKVRQIIRITNDCDENWYVDPDNSKQQQYSMRKKDATGKTISYSVIYECTDGTIYDGEGISDGGSIIPHGKGQWTFMDGSILEGEGVAWMGEPRKPIKRFKR